MCFSKFEIHVCVTLLCYCEHNLSIKSTSKKNILPMGSLVMSYKIMLWLKHIKQYIIFYVIFIYFFGFR